jgi:hypothetical protein
MGLYLPPERRAHKSRLEHRISSARISKFVGFRTSSLFYTATQQSVKILTVKIILADKLKKFTDFNALTPELNPSPQLCLPRFFTGDFNF